MRIETAISLFSVVPEALVHRENCLKSARKDAPAELLAAAFADLEADGADTAEAREWLRRRSHGDQLNPRRHRQEAST